MDKIWIRYKPSLFQHIGIHSSLKGKVQKLKDKQFGQIPEFIPHSNPEAKVFTSIQAYKTYDLEKAYLGTSFFWGVSPKINDQVSFSLILLTVLQCCLPGPHSQPFILFVTYE